MSTGARARARGEEEEEDEEGAPREHAQRNVNVGLQERVTIIELDLRGLVFLVVKEVLF